MDFGRRLQLAALSLAAVLAGCQTVGESPGAPANLLIRNVTVIPMERPGAMPGQDVLVEGDRITRIGPTGSMRRRAARVVDGAGKYLIPGLWDMHAHALIGDPGPETLQRYRDQGIVGLRDLGSTLEELQQARRLLASRADLPAVVAAGPLLDGPRQPWMQTMALPLSTVEEARNAAASLAEGGVDFLKIYNNLSPEQFAAIAEAARARGLAIAGHVPFRMTVEQVSSAGQASIEHAGLQLVTDCIPNGRRAIPAELSAWIARGFPGRYEERTRWWALRDAEQCQALYRRMASRRTWVTPTLTNEIVGGAWTTEADIALLDARQQESCRNTLTSVNSAPALRDGDHQRLFDLVAELHRAGVPLLAGTDTPNGCLAPGRSLHLELRLLVRSGLTPWEALRTATTNPALFLGRQDEGAIRPGAVANLLLLDADPLQDIGNTAAISAVVLRGAVTPPASSAAAGGQ